MITNRSTPLAEDRPGHGFCPDVRVGVEEEVSPIATLMSALEPHLQSDETGKPVLQLGPIEFVPKRPNGPGEGGLPFDAHRSELDELKAAILYEHHGLSKMARYERCRALERESARGSGNARILLAVLEEK